MGILILRRCKVCHKEFAQETGQEKQYCSQACNRKAWKERHPEKRALKDGTEKLYRYAGHVRKFNTPEEDYLDFRFSELTRSDVYNTLQAGNLPPGLRLRCGTIVWEVTGRYGYPQRMSVAA